MSDIVPLWYSAEQRAHLGRYVVYRTVEGAEVVCTQVGEPGGWPDYERVGETTIPGGFVREVWEDPAKEAMMREVCRSGYQLGYGPVYGHGMGR